MTVSAELRWVVLLDMAGLTDDELHEDGAWLLSVDALSRDGLLCSLSSPIIPDASLGFIQEL